MITPKCGEVGRSGSEVKVNISLQRRTQPTKIPAQKTGPNKGTSEFTISDVSLETGLSGAGAKSICAI